jgi:hypothetical protein
LRENFLICIIKPGLKTEIEKAMKKRQKVGRKFEENCPTFLKIKDTCCAAALASKKHNLFYAGKDKSGDRVYLFQAMKKTLRDEEKFYRGTLKFKYADYTEFLKKFWFGKGGRNVNPTRYS